MGCDALDERKLTVDTVVPVRTLVDRRLTRLLARGGGEGTSVHVPVLPGPVALILAGVVIRTGVFSPATVTGLIDDTGRARGS